MTETSFGDQHSRPTLDEFKHICHTELHWLVTEYGFREVAADAAQSDNPFRVLFVRDDLTVDIEGINYGSHVMFRIRDRHGRSIGVNNLDPAFVPSNKPHKWVEVGQAVEIAHDARRLRALGTPLLEGDLSVFDACLLYTSGLAGVSSHIVKSMELRKRLPLRMNPVDIEEALARIGRIIQAMVDPDIFVWIGRAQPPTDVEIHRAATIIADRLCGSVANPIIRNAQERRQLATIKAWLEARGYSQSASGDSREFDALPPGTFAFHKNVSVMLAGGVRRVTIPIDVVVMPKKARYQDLPLLLEAKSAGDFTNTNKRRKEEAMKMALLRANYGESVQFNLFLCGYFDSGYLGYEAAEGIDWVWEHRIDDLALFGL